VARAVGVDRLLPSLGYVMADWPHDATRCVDHVIGAFYLIRRAAFEHLGGFDERFFVYLEDLDLSLRVHAAGGRCLYVSDADAYHAGGGTTRSIRSKRLFYAVRSRLQFARKHFGPGGAVAVWTASLALEPLVRTGAALWHRSAGEIVEVWRAYVLLIKWLLR
jgi:GT2 family glycosyltransferase